MPRDPLLVWFAAGEPILSPAERHRILARLRAHPEVMKVESRRFWSSGHRADPPRLPPDDRVFLAAFRRWRTESRTREMVRS